MEGIGEAEEGEVKVWVMGMGIEECGKRSYILSVCDV